MFKGKMDRGELMVRKNTLKGRSTKGRKTTKRKPKKPRKFCVTESEEQREKPKKRFYRRVGKGKARF